MSALFDSPACGDLRARLAGLASFNRHVAHDLRGPLGSMAGGLRLARQALARGEHDLVSRLLDALARRADGTLNLLAEMLALAEADDAPLAMMPMDLTDLAASAIEEVSHAAEAPLPEFCLHPLPVVPVAPALLRQVFVNLLANATKFTHGVPRPRVEIGVAPLWQGARAISVCDNGVGFDMQRAGRLFEPFSRLHGAEYAGHGLGLSLVRRVVQRHGGTVWAESAPCGGARFCFTLAGLPVD